MFPFAVSAPIYPYYPPLYYSFIYIEHRKHGNGNKVTADRHGFFVLPLPLLKMLPLL